MSLLRTQDHTLLALGIILAGLGSFLSCLFIPEFVELYKGFAHIPVATAILLILSLPVPELGR